MRPLLHFPTPSTGISCFSTFHVKHAPIRHRTGLSPPWVHFLAPSHPCSLDSAAPSSPLTSPHRSPSATCCVESRRRQPSPQNFEWRPFTEVGEVAPHLCQLHQTERPSCRNTLSDPPHPHDALGILGDLIPHTNTQPARTSTGGLLPARARARSTSTTAGIIPLSDRD